MQVVTGYNDEGKAIWRDLGPGRAGYSSAGTPESMYGINPLNEIGQAHLTGVEKGKFLSWHPTAINADEVNRASAAFCRKFGVPPKRIFCRTDDLIPQGSTVPFVRCNLIPKGDWYLQ